MSKQTSTQDLNSNINVDTQIWISTELTLELLQIKSSDLYKLEAVHSVSSQKNTKDKRKKVHNFLDLVSLMKKRKADETMWKLKSDEPSSELIETLKGHVNTLKDESDFQNEMKDRQLTVACIFEMLNVEDDTFQYEDGPLKFIQIGVDTPSIRNIKNVIYGFESEYDEPEDYIRILPHVEKTCFGHLDEKAVECIKHCKVQGPCSIARGEIFKQIAFKINMREAEKMQNDRLKASMSEVVQRRKSALKDIDRWVTSSK